MVSFYRGCKLQTWPLANPGQFQKRWIAGDAGDEKEEAFMGVFWDVDGGGVVLEAEGCAPVTVTVDGNAVVVHRLRTGEVMAADPARQSLGTVRVSMSVGVEYLPHQWTGRARRS